MTRAGALQLQSYNWPGNIRELRNVIERAVILARGGGLEFDLPGDDAQPSAHKKVERGDEAVPVGFLTESEMQQRERENLLVVLGKADWRIKGSQGAAELLGVKPSTLLSRIKKMGLSRPQA